MTDLVKAARSIAKARAALESAMRQGKTAAIEAHAAGMPETEIATTLGVNRMTVRRWLGKLP